MKRCRGDVCLQVAVVGEQREVQEEGESWVVLLGKLGRPVCVMGVGGWLGGTDGSSGVGGTLSRHKALGKSIIILVCCRVCYKLEQ